MRKSLSLLKWLFKEFQKNFLPTKNAGGPRTSRVFVVQRYSKCIQKTSSRISHRSAEAPIRGEKASQTRWMNLLSNDRTFARSIDIDEKFRNGVRHHSRFFYEELISEAGHAVVLRVWEGRLPALQGSKQAATRSGSRRRRKATNFSKSRSSRAEDAKAEILPLIFTACDRDPRSKPFKRPPRFEKAH